MNKILIHSCWLFIGIILFVGCKENTTNNEKLLQGRSIQLSKPIFLVENTLIQDSSDLIIGRVEEGATIRYTTDGSEPDLKSDKYEGPIQISQAGIVKARVYHADWKPSDISAIEFLKAGFQPKSIALVSQINEKYKQGGVSTLIENQRGTLVFSSKKWIGADAPFSAVVDLGEITSLDRFRLCFLKDVGSWIFPPKRIVVFSSIDGISFTEIASKEFETETGNSAPELMITTLKLNVNTRIVKVLVENLDTIPEWHDGNGSPAWLFMDEWIFY